MRSAKRSRMATKPIKPTWVRARVRVRVRVRVREDIGRCMGDTGERYGRYMGDTGEIQGRQHSD